ncbi:MAG: rhodanese-like domain-containing protein, partial [Magnetovibrio sp.]|nr:rhodanese-like domain-containing protein [Magnetovibrio sp.]
MTATVTTAELREQLDQALANRAELAVLDVREAGQYAAGHLFFATHVPYSRLEVEIGEFVPRLTTQIVVYDAGDGVAARAQAALTG